MTSTNGTGAVAESSSSGSELPATTGSSTSETTALDDSGDSGGESSGGVLEPVCGNGVVEGGESCDDDSASCQNDCTFSCEVGSIVEVSPRPGAQHSFIAVPIPVPDGSGDLVLADSGRVARYTRSGVEVWTVDYVDTDLPYWIVPVAGEPDFFWMAGQRSGPDSTLGLYAFDNGSAVDVGFFPDSEGTALSAFGEDGGFIQITLPFTPEGRFSRVRARSPDGTELWATEVSREPLGSAEFLFQVDQADDGSIYLGGYNSERGPVKTENWVVKLAPDGELLWERLLFESEGNYFGYAHVAARGDDVLVLAGRQIGTDPALGSLPYYETRLFLLDAGGEVLAEIDPSNLVREGRVQVTSIERVGPDRFLITGALDVGGNGQPWFAIIDGEGTAQCQRIVETEGPLEAIISGSSRDLDGRLILAGARSQDGQPGFFIQERFWAFLGSE